MNAKTMTTDLKAENRALRAEKRALKVEVEKLKAENLGGGGSDVTRELPLELLVGELATVEPGEIQHGIDGARHDR